MLSIAQSLLSNIHPVPSLWCYTELSVRGGDSIIAVPCPFFLVLHRVIGQGGVQGYRVFTLQSKI